MIPKGRLWIFIVLG
jgi:hypothetical protein